MTARMRIVTLPAVVPSEWADVPTGSAIGLLEPAHALNRIVILRLNGEYVLRRDWGRLVNAGDEIEWLLDPPGDRESFRTILQIAVVAAALIPGAQGFAPWLAAASVAYNLLVPPHIPEAGAAAGSVFSTSVGGNAARLDDPIWRVCGIDKITPPFAGLPYVEFVDDDGDDIDNVQFYYGVFAVGYGPYDLLADFLGKTPVSHYQDVLVHALLAPGEQPTVARANVVSSQDISAFDLEAGTYVGGYVACPPSTTVSSIGVDVFAAQGLGATDEDGDPVAVTVEWRVEYRVINDGGTPIGAWILAPSGTLSKSVSTNTPQRWSNRFTISPPARVEVRVARSNLRDRRPNARDGIQWVGLRGYLTDPAPLDPDTSHYEIVLRASQQLSQANQNDINLIVQGKCRTWTPDDGWNCELKDWDNYVATRTPAWWLADMWSDATWGEGLPDERINLQGLYDWAQTTDPRQDRFDYTFSNTTDAWSASQLIARAGRARVFRRYGVRTLTRDEFIELPGTAFTPRMCVAGTGMVVDEALPDMNTPDGVIAQFKSNRKWDQDFVECPCPGVTVMERPIYRQYPGIQGRTHAQREGLYDAADMALRTRTVSFQTEMQAVLTSFLEATRWLPQIANYGQTGDVAFWDADTLVMGLTEPADFSVTPVYLALRRDDGSLTAPVVVTPGPTRYDITLPAAPDFDLVLDDGTRERPVFLLGPALSNEVVKPSSITDGGRSAKGAQYYKVVAVIDDDRVHEADNAYLPGPGDVQDPVLIPGDDEGGGGALYLPNLSTTIVVAFAAAPDGNQKAIYHLYNIGTAAGEAYGLPPTDVPNQWLLFGAVDPTVAALFEARFTYVGGDQPYGVVTGVATPPTGGDALDTWLNLGTSRSVELLQDTDADTAAGIIARAANLRLEIRAVGETVTQATATIILLATRQDPVDHF